MAATSGRCSSGGSGGLSRRAEQRGLPCATPYRAEVQRCMHHHMTDQACPDWQRHLHWLNLRCRAETQHFMHYHMTDQATCLAAPKGGLAVDFVGR